MIANFDVHIIRGILFNYSKVVMVLRLTFKCKIQSSQLLLYPFRNVDKPWYTVNKGVIWPFDLALSMKILYLGNSPLTLWGILMKLGIKKDHNDHNYGAFYKENAVPNFLKK
jgi:hypothetical protein